MKEMFRKLTALFWEKKRKVTTDAVGSAPRSSRSSHTARSPRSTRSGSSGNCSSSNSSCSDDLSDTEEKCTNTDPKKQNGRKKKSSYNGGNVVNIRISDSKHTHIGNNFYIGDREGARSGGENKEDFNKEPQEAETEEEINIPSDELVNAFDSNKVVTEEELHAAKGLIGNGLASLCEQLGFPKSRMEQLLAEHKPREEGIYKILLTWKQQNARIATVGILCDSLWKVKEFDAAESVAYVHSLR